MSPCKVWGAAIALFVIMAAGCSRPAGEPSPPTPNNSPTAKVWVETSAAPPAENDTWRGLERHEIQLDQKLLVVKGSKGVIGCPYLNAASFEKFGEACAIIPAVDTAGMLDSKVTAVTDKAKKLGIEVGMPGREAFDKIR